MRHLLTTLLGIAAIALAIVGAALAARVLTQEPPPQVGLAPAAQFQIFVIERILLLSVKAGLIATGILILFRSRWAGPLLALTLLISLADACAVSTYFSQPEPMGLAFGQREKELGWWLGLFSGPLFYLAMLVYLLLPRTRAEFAALKA